MTTRKRVKRFGGGLQGETRFADAAGAGEREQANVLSAEQVEDFSQFALPSDQRSERGWQSAYLLKRCVIVHLLPRSSMQGVDLATVELEQCGQAWSRPRS
jgi:hypothetical protein